MQTGRAPIRILIVDDTPANRRLLVRILERLGHQADEAAGGLEALDLLGRTEHDLVLLDLQMPEPDGFETARRIRAQDPRDIRVLALTGFAEDEVRDACARAGIDGIITKPFTIQEIARAIGEVEGGGTRSGPATGA